MTNNLLVLQSDFGLVDGAVSAMIGVALQEEPSLGVRHLIHVGVGSNWHIEIKRLGD